jgi:hypothetical protein
MLDKQESIAKHPAKIELIGMSNFERRDYSYSERYL